MIGFVTEMVTIGFMAKKQQPSREKLYPNGLAEAISRAKEVDPDIGPTKLARLTNMNKQTVDRYIKQQRKLTVPAAQVLAPHVRASVAEILLVDSNVPRFERIPLLSWVSAGRLAEADGVRLRDAKERILMADLPRGNWIALRVEGHSMDRLAPDGSLIFIDVTDTKPRDGHFYVFSEESGATTFKRFKAGRPPKLQPYSTDPDYETRSAPEGLRVIGRVRRVITDLR